MTTSCRRTVPTPRLHQITALDAVETLYRQGVSRCQLRMACGSGKTLLGPWLAQRMGARTVAVFAPSIALVSQMLSAWRASGVALRALAVCSDPTTAAGRAEVGVDGIDPFRSSHNVDGVVTTNAGTVARFLDRADDHRQELTVVISTYHSAPVVAEALRLADHCRGLDLVVADEAHHLAGRTNPVFVPVLRDAAIPARWRLFQTATPVVVAGGAITALDELSGAADQARCMDDTAVFGPVAYTLSVGDAIGEGLLADYRVVVTTPGHQDGGSPDKAVLGALCDVVARYGVRRVLTFHNRVASAREFAQRVNATTAIDGVAVRGFAVDGTMPDEQRSAVLSTLGDSAGDTVTVISSAQCLREGIDVPAVDAVVFADPRTSTVGIIQAIGRALRTHPGKAIGTIVVPLVLDPEHDDQEQLADSDYRHVWRVLRGLRAHDARVGFDLDRARQHRGADVPLDPNALPWLSVLGDEPGAVLTRLIEHSSARWEQSFGQLAALVERRGSAAMVTTTGPLGDWITLQRILFADDSLDTQRVRRLEELPGWRWSASAAADERTLVTLQEVLAEHGTVAESSRGESIFTGRVDGLQRPLRFWVATKCCQYYDGTLEPWLQSALEALPGWNWCPLSEEDATGIAAYRSFVQWERHTDIPVDHVEVDVEVGRWLHQARRRKAFGVLPPMLESMLLSTAPATGTNGTRVFSWKTGPTRWAISLEALASYVARTGTAAGMPVRQTELVDGQPVDVYAWLQRVRWRYHRGKLTAEQILSLESVPGFAWRIRGAGGVTITAPKPGVANHGKRGYSAGCHCIVCVTDNRAYQRQAQRSTKADYRADWVDAADVRAHLMALVALDGGKDRSDAVFTAGAIAAAAGVPTRRVGELLRNPQARCHPMHRRILLATTADDVHAIRSEARTRGRRGIAGRGPVADPEPTWALTDALIEAGWTARQLAAALGYHDGTKVPLRGRTVTAEKEKVVAIFVGTLNGNFTPPPAHQRTKRATWDPPRVALAPAADPDALHWALSLLEQGYQIGRVARVTALPVDVVISLAGGDSAAADDAQERAAS